LSYIDAALKREEAWRAYYCDPEVIARLRKIKQKMDPRETFLESAWYHFQKRQ
jgi:FAD/FMN-containing dehydrogenase